MYQDISLQKMLSTASARLVLVNEEDMDTSEWYDKQSFVNKETKKYKVLTSTHEYSLDTHEYSLNTHEYEWVTHLAAQLIISLNYGDIATASARLMYPAEDRWNLSLIFY